MSKLMIATSAVAFAAASLLLGVVGTATAAPAQTGAHRVAIAHTHHRHDGGNVMNGAMGRQMMGMIGPMVAGMVANGGVSGLGQVGIGNADMAGYAPVVNALVSSGAMSGAMSGLGGSGMNLGALAGMAGGMGGATTGTATP